MNSQDERSVSLAVGVVMRRTPGVTRWAKWAWSVSALIPGAGEAYWKCLREEGAVAEFHAGTARLTLWRTDAEAYRIALSEPAPAAYVVLRQPPEDAPGDWPYAIRLVTANPHEAMQYAEGGDDVVEKVAMPPALVAWVQDWTDRHFTQEPFVKRKRKRHLEDMVEEGIGDPRIAQMTDVYRAPTTARKARKP